LSKQTSTNERPKLPLTRLGDTGLIVSRPSLGCMMIGDAVEEHVGKLFALSIASREHSIKILDEYYNRGGNFLDTANIYDDGGSERVIALWLKKKSEEGIKDIRDKIVITTKCNFPFGTDINQRGLSRKAIIRAIEESLDNLQTDYVDLYLCHGYDPLTPLNEVLQVFNQLILEGKIRYWGVSNWPVSRLVQAVERCRANGWIPPCNAQMQYSLLSRDIEIEFIDACIEYGISITAYSPLSSGWLTGRVTRETGVKSSERAQFWKNLGLITSEEKAYDIIDSLTKVAKGVGRSPSQVALRFLTDYNPKVQIIPIIGSAKLQHIEDGLDSETLNVPSESIKTLNEISKIPPPYPMNLFPMFTSFRKLNYNYYQ